MPKIPSPLGNVHGAPTGMNVEGTAFANGGSPNNATQDRLRQFVIFELVNVVHDEAQVPQSNATFPYMVMHMNPSSWEESYTKLITRQATRGGFLEQHWGEELDSITASGSSGMFVSVASGLSALNRKATIGYRKYLDLVALYKNNGLVYDQRGNVVLKGGLNLHFDSNIYNGYFENLTVTESADNPYTFELSWTFKVYHQVRNVGG